MFAHLDLPLFWKQFIWGLGDSKSKDEGSLKEARCHLVRVVLHARRKEPGSCTTDAGGCFWINKNIYSAVFYRIREELLLCDLKL